MKREQMKIVSGTIKYPLWQVTGTRELVIHYTLTEEDAIGDIVINMRIEGEGDKPEIEEDQMEEILDMCVDDSKTSKGGSNRADKMLDDYDFSTN